MMDVDVCTEQINAAKVLAELLSELSVITDYRTLRDSIPRRLASLLQCRCVLFYQRNGDTLQFASGSFGDQPGWSASLLAFAHINPIQQHSDLPEACAWQERRVVGVPAATPMLVAAPLMYRHRCIGVLVAIRQAEQGEEQLPGQAGREAYWLAHEIPLIEAVAGVIALALENARLLQHDRERIQELSLLNRIGSQMNCSMYDLERLRSIIVQYAREISAADLCEVIEPSTTIEAAPWINSQLRALLFQRFSDQRSPLPLVIERPGDASNPQASEYLEHLATTIKTFFAVPLLSSRSTSGKRTLVQGGATQHEPYVLGFIAGGYHHPWQLKRGEIVLLQVLTSQASAMLESIHLMAEVVEARNEAHKFLRQVLEDQRIQALILECIPSGLITTDRVGRITTFNRAAETILGYRPSEAVGQPLHKMLELCSSNDVPCGWSARSSDLSARASGRSENAQHSETLYEVLRTGKSCRGTMTVLDRQRQDVVLDVDIVPLSDHLGEGVGMLVTFNDVTSVHRLEEEKRRLDRLATLGEMAANVAHEVRNPLASIKTSMQMLMDDLASPASEHAAHLLEGQEDRESLNTNTPSFPASEQMAWIQESIGVVLKEVERLDCIVRDLLLFARPRHMHRVACDMSELCDRVLHLLHPQCAGASIVVHRLYADVPQVQVDMSQMEQVLLNIYMNAIQAMPDGGILTVSCHPAAAGGGIEITVSDTGTGIPPEHLERIFQPFFTTRAHGIGLGLAITRRLVEDHGGHLHVEGHFGYGATFAIHLPLPTETVWSER